MTGQFLVIKICTVCRKCYVRVFKIHFLTCLPLVVFPYALGELEVLEVLTMVL